MKYRPDIDVLRAIAVLAVVLFHAGFHIAFGGYVGVLCPLSDGTQTFYKDQHHLTPYGALWLQHHGFSDLSAFISAVLREASG